MRNNNYRHIIIALLIGVAILSFFECCRVEAVGYRLVIGAETIAGERESHDMEAMRWEYTEKFNSGYFVIITIIEIVFIITAVKKRNIFFALLIDCAKIGIPYWKNRFDAMMDSMGGLYSKVTRTCDFSMAFYLLVALECVVALLYIWEFFSMWRHERQINTTGLYFE